MFLIDSHCHLDDLNYNSLHLNVDDVLLKSKKYNVKMFLTVCTSISEFHILESISKNRDNVFISCGIHPLYINYKYNLDELYLLSLKNNVIAIGETGLDYFKMNKNNKKEQEKVFREHIYVSKKSGKPIIIHARNSYGDVISILKEEKFHNLRAIFHCFSGSLSDAKSILELGFYISFSGNITFNSSYYLREVVRYVPMSNILIETDSPYLSPVPYRGKENQPSYLYEIAKYMSIIKDCKLSEVADSTTRNFTELFNLKI